MRVTVDGVELAGGSAGLGEAMESARRLAAERGRIVVEALGDGAPIDASLLDRPDRAGSYRTLEFATADPRAIVGEALREAARLLGGVREEQGAVVAAVDGAEIETARQRLERVLSVWGTCVATVRDGGEMLGRDPRAGVGEGESVEASVQALMRALGEVKRCLAAEDWAGLSDVVGEDLERLAGEWEALVAGLLKEAEGA